MRNKKTRRTHQIRTPVSFDKTVQDIERALASMGIPREEMRKGIESVESAFSGFVDWLSTPKLPEKMAEAFEQRGYHPELPAPKKEQAELVYETEVR